jgi:glutamyl-tRNA synthetase
MWFNEHYIRETSVAELMPRVKELAEESKFDTRDDEYLQTVVELLHERVSKIEEFVAMGSFFFEAPKEYDANALKKWKDDSAGLVTSYIEKIESLSDAEFEATTLKSKLEETINENEVGFGKLMMPLRIAVTGQGFGPDLFQSLELLGKEEVLGRLDTALKIL